MALVDLIRGKGKAAVGGLAGVLQAANSANPMEQNTYGQPIPPAPKWANFLLNSGNAIANAVMAPSNALAGKYDQIVVGPDGKVLSMIDPRMMDDAATLSGLLTTGAMPIPKLPNTLGMGGGKMAAGANPAFDNWFGGSKVVDSKGKPLIVYHGTTQVKDFDTFSLPGSKTGRQTGGSAIYFSTSPTEAGNFARYGENQRILPTYVKAEKPFDFRAEGDMAALEQFVSKNFDKVAPGALYDAKTAVSFLKAGDFGLLEQPAVKKWMKSKGYDGYWVKEGEGRPLNIAVFDPKQIKSAIGNRGTYDPNDPNILRAGGIPMIPMPTDQKDQQ